MPFTRANHEAVSKWTPEELAGIPDPATAEGWAFWREHGWHDENRETAIRWFAPGSKRQQDAVFIAAHWTPAGDDNCICDAYDPEVRACTAHESRPPVCRDYPWYGDDPLSRVWDGMIPQCSYLADVPPSQRPEGSRPLIPITPVRAAGCR